MATTEQVRQALTDFVKKHIAGGFVGIVTDNADAVAKGLVTVKYDDLEFTARLQSVSNKTNNGILPVPATGSQVFCASEGNSDNAFIVVACAELEKIIFNGGTLGGLVKLQELKDNLDSLKQYVEAIHNALPAAFNAIGASSSANGATGAASYQAAMAGKNIQLKDMENTKILH
ncbi:MAG: hypothetical protein LBN98_03555 [Prevotellaceae bacterium]|jgi:hypothetical protein|nr:hypothetical protein [Prevotellaceae bacterium]